MSVLLELELYSQFGIERQPEYLLTKGNGRCNSYIDSNSFV